LFTALHVAGRATAAQEACGDRGGDQPALGILRRLPDGCTAKFRLLELAPEFRLW
jgi:hypothetical protein